MKKIFILSLLITSSMHAVLLKSGSQVPYDLAEKTWQVIKELENKKRIDILGDLLRAARSEDLKIEPGYSIRYISDIMHELRKSREINELFLLGLCNKEGYLQADIAEIIKSSIHITWKGRMTLFYSITSPISLKNYFMPKYWFKKQSDTFF